MTNAYLCFALCVFSVLSNIYSYGQAATPVLQNPVISQTVSQPLGTTLSVNRMENTRYAEQFVAGSSTGGIQEAINDLPSGGTVVLPVGTTTTTTTVTVNKTVTIIGHGPENTVVNFTQSTGDEFLITAPGVILQDFLIRRPDGTMPMSGSGVHFSCSCNHLDMFRMRVYLQFQGVVTDTNTWYLSIDRSTVDHSTDAGIFLNGNATRLTNSDIFYNLRDGVIVEGNATFNGSGNVYFANEGMGIQFYATPLAGSNQAQLTNEETDSNGLEGVGVQNMADFTFTDGWIGSNGVTFTGTFPNQQPDFQHFTAGIRGAFCDQSDLRCRFNNNQIGNNSSSGLYFTGARTFEASNNQLIGNGQGGGGATSSGIYVQNSGTIWVSGRLEGNRAWNDGAGSAGLFQNYGIVISGGSSTGSEIIVIGNDLVGNSVLSLSNTSPARQVVTNNICSTGVC